VSIDDRIEFVKDFAELGRYFREPVKNYSSGMQVRLAFSIAIRARGDILILDEVLAVGDEAFQKKCKEYFQELKRRKKTVILVTHDMKSVEEICDRGILLDGGKIKARGSNENIAMAYKDLFVVNKESHKRQLIQVIDRFVVEGQSAKDVKPHGMVSLAITINSREDIVSGAVIGINIKSENGLVVTSLGVGGVGEPQLAIKKGVNEVVIEFNNIYRNGEYLADLLFVDYRNERRRVLYEVLDKKIFISSGFVGREHASVRPKYKVKVTHV
jgi:ABC-2 type transport system ATP-binding protein